MLLSPAILATITITATIVDVATAASTATSSAADSDAVFATDFAEYAALERMLLWPMLLLLLSLTLAILIMAADSYYWCC